MELIAHIDSIFGCIAAAIMVYKAFQWIRKKTKKSVQRGPSDSLLSRFR